MTGDIPMFPLGAVLFPGGYLPLHVFEGRYRELVRVALEGTSEFGVVLIERGSEVGGGDVRFDVGCVARIVAAARLSDGGWALGAVGTRRFRVLRWLADAPYPRAEIEAWDDLPVGPDADRRRGSAAAGLRRVLALHAEAGAAVPDATVEITDDPLGASYQIAALAPLGPLDQLDLLRSEGPDQRFDLLARLLADEAAVLARRLEGG